MRKSFSAFFVTLCLLFMMVGIAGAAPSAVLSGRVTDLSGAAIPEATVLVTSLSTGRTVEVRTTGEGLYVVPTLSPGRYRIRVNKAGFAPAQVDEIQLNVSGTATQDVQMRVGEVATRIEVVAANTLIDYEAVSVSTTVDRKFAESLPLNGRSFQTLLELTPGVNTVPAAYNSPGQFVVNGQRSNANYFTIDGVSANIGSSLNIQVQQQAAGTLPGLTAMGGTNNLLSVDALEEFEVETSTFAPEHGRMPGGQITITTRSGTNQYHGSAFEYFRNEKLDANDWFSNAAGLDRAPMRQNNFGGVFGGPVWVPGVYKGKDRTFFFFNYEGQRNRLPQFVEALVPTQQLRDEAIDSMKGIMNISPLPNRDAKPGDPYGTARYVASYGDPQSLNATSLKIDHYLNGSLSVFGRFTIAPSQSAQRTHANQLDVVDINTKTFTLGADFTISPRMFNEFRFNYSHNTGNWDGEQLLVDGAQPAPESLWAEGASPDTTSVMVRMIDWSYGTGNNLNLGRTVGNGQRQFNWVDQFSFTTGAHTFKTGVDWRRLNPLASLRERSYSYAFESPEVAATTGVTSYVSVQGFSPPGHFTFDNFSWYGQDTWRITPNLTLTYGLRWEVNPPPSERDGLLPYTAAGIEDPMTASLAPLGTPLWETTWDNFAPRVGVAYQLSKRHDLVIRSGWGIYYDLGTSMALSGYSGYPYSTYRSSYNVAFPAEGDILEPATVSLTPPVAASIYAFPDLELPKTYQWNVTAEKGFGNSNLLSVSYVGAAGRGLLGKDLLRTNSRDEVIQLNPDQFKANSSVTVVKNRSESDYHALQVQFRRRMRNGLQTQVSYTWAKAIDDLSDETSAALPLIRPEVALEQGPSDFDIRHSLSLALTYDLPHVEQYRLAKAITRDWSLSAFRRFRTATPINLAQYNDLLHSGVTYTVRPDLVGGVPVVLEDPTAPGGRRLNPDAFATFTEARQGTLGRNAIRGFDRIRQVDLSVRREFPLSERVRLQFSAEIFNVTNTPTFGQPDTSLTSSTFGESTATLNRSLGSYSTGGSSQGFSPLYQIGGPRSVQLVLRLSF